MDYKPHLQRIQDQYGKLEEYDNCTDFEKCIILLKKQGCTYKQIQKWLGNPSKETIKEVILKYIPETLNNDNNKNKLQSTQYLIEKRLIGILKTTDNRLYDLDEFGISCFYLVEGRLFFITEDKTCFKFIDWDDRTQMSILQNIAKILNFKL